MSFLSAARKIAKHDGSASRDYLADQNRAAMARAFNPSLADLEKPAARMAIVDGYTRPIVPQLPMKAVWRVDPLAPLPEPDAIQVSEQPTPIVPMVHHCTTGAPVSVTAADYLAMPEDQRQIVRAQAMAFKGAIDRVRNHGTTLTTAFHAELDYQASIQRGLARATADGKSKRHTKTQSKIDKKAGRPKTRAPGVAAFKKSVTVESSTINGNNITAPGKGVLDGVYGVTSSRKRRQDEPDMLMLNKWK